MIRYSSFPGCPYFSFKQNGPLMRMSFDVLRNIECAEVMFQGEKAQY